MKRSDKITSEYEKELVQMLGLTYSASIKNYITEQELLPFHLYEYQDPVKVVVFDLFTRDLVKKLSALCVSPLW